MWRAPTGVAPGRTLVIAHRGDSVTAPENTLPAVQAAIAEGADLVEVDIQRTSDDHLIVVHDTTFARTTDVASVFPGRQHDPVESFTLEEVRRLDAGAWKASAYAGTRVTTLHDLTRAVAHTRTGLLVELKNPTLYPGYEKEVARELKASGLVAQHRAWVHSFGEAALARFHALAPSVPVGQIDETGTIPTDETRWISSLNASSESLTGARVAAALHEGVAVLAWPRSSADDTASHIERLVDDRVTGIITNDPPTARFVLASKD
jgi:glycerophosphoryl diester phosphodiesterase